ncbi:hypothetical protein ACFQ07_33435 [Actinomadura adrarensis]|uniref:XRE family transcriptional regulator n=1 Tax=Actinomadura adrarensis TaxID=1819600 RepID=A0ABW3CSG4_9ACTN
MGAVDVQDVEAIRETSQALVKLDTLHGGNDLYPLALRIFRASNRQLATGDYNPTVERDLMAATGEAGEVAAWLAYDADQQDASRQIIHEALLLSRQAGDRSMELFQLSHLAMQSVQLHRAAEAYRIVGDVLGTEELAPRVGALFNIRRGRALAQMGDRMGAFDALDSACSTLDQGISPRDPYWTWWVTDPEISWHRAMAHAELGEWSVSVSLFQEAARQRTEYQRAWYNDQAHLLNALVHVRAWQDAEPVILELLNGAGAVESGRTTNLLRRVADRIARAKDVPSTVTDAAGELLARHAV